MINIGRKFLDRALGRGSASIAVPVMDGALHPNGKLDHAQIVAVDRSFDGLASDGNTLWITSGAKLFRLDGRSLVADIVFDEVITAIAASSDGRHLAVALGGSSIQVFERQQDRWRLAATMPELLQHPARHINGLCFDGDTTLLATDGSLARPYDEWCHDLLELGETGRVIRWRFADATAHAPTVIASGLKYAYGPLAVNGSVLYSESWRHRVRAIGENLELRDVTPELPAYPSRMSPATDGNIWLTCFIRRTQMVEFILKEREYCRRMISEVDPRYWMAPAFSTGDSFLEPIQRASVKQMGILKPWAPSRSYGLVIKVAPTGRLIQSIHSLADGKNHGITAAAENQGALYMVSRGAGRLLKIEL